MIELIWAIVIAVIASTVSSIVSRDIVSNVDRICNWIIRLAVRRAPHQMRERLAEEWSADIAEIPSTASKLVVAIGFLVAVLRIRTAYEWKAWKSDYANKTNVDSEFGTRSRKHHTVGKLAGVQLGGELIDLETTRTPSALRMDVYRQLDQLSLSPQTADCLKNDNIVYVGDIVQMSRHEILCIPHFGEEALLELENELEKMGLFLGIELSNWPPSDISEMSDLIARADGLSKR